MIYKNGTRVYFLDGNCRVRSGHVVKRHVGQPCGVVRKVTGYDVRLPSGKIRYKSRRKLAREIVGLKWLKKACR